MRLSNLTDRRLLIFQRASRFPDFTEYFQLVPFNFTNSALMNGTYLLIMNSAATDIVFKTMPVVIYEQPAFNSSFNLGNVSIATNASDFFKNFNKTVITNTTDKSSFLSDD